MAALERHYAPKEIAQMWGMSHDAIIRLFRNEPGVLCLAPARRRGVRTRTTYRIPESVVNAVYLRCQNK